MMLTLVFATMILSTPTLPSANRTQDADPMMFSMDNSYDPEEWVHVATSRSGSIRTIRAKDRAQIQTVGRVWIKDNHSQDATERARETKSLMEIDCKNETLKIISIVSYDKYGAVLNSFSPQSWEQRTQQIVPQSMGSTIQWFVCAVK